ncbi:MAG: DUF2239 family protein [Acinetobacter populi]|jgi:hypothetical protein|uniref:DUF2239 family protein n=1 Tax=Acinetobacter populi TaxID=1582270 RepID=UPI0023558D8F|nr:DUF2239 family protein [Acinetobacter populi]MCH4247422.1 DUF2239 family protein [Acinetobacter populi]
MHSTIPHFTAFQTKQIFAQGELIDIIEKMIDEQILTAHAMLFIFDNYLGKPIDLDLSGSPEQVRARYTTKNIEIKVGRPKLGVKAKEITLLQRQWDWLSSQSGNISATLRKLIDKEMNDPHSETNIQLRKQAVDRFMSNMLGDSGVYEEASRALYRDQAQIFYQLIEQAPIDIQQHIHALSKYAFITE